MLSTPLPKLAISFSCVAGLADHRSVDAVRHGRDEHIMALHGGDEFRLRLRRVVDVELGLEELAHARLDRIRQFPRDEHARLLLLMQHPLAPLSVERSLTKLPDSGFLRRHFLTDGAAETNRTLAPPIARCTCNGGNASAMPVERGSPCVSVLAVSVLSAFLLAVAMTGRPLGQRNGGRQ